MTTYVIVDRSEEVGAHAWSVVAEITTQDGKRDVTLVTYEHEWVAVDLRNTLNLHAELEL